MQGMNYFLENLKMEKILPAQLEIMEKPISLEEIKLVITHLKVNSAPGVERFTSEFYKTFWKE